MIQQTDERLNRLTKIIARAGGIAEADVEGIGSSPFLNARIRARIAEQKRRTEQGSGWLATLLVASRAIAALLLVTIVAASAFWFSRANATRGVAGGGTRNDDVARVIVGGTCALSATEECAISNDEVLATLFAEEGRELR